MTAAARRVARTRAAHRRAAAVDEALAAERRRADAAADPAMLDPGIRTLATALGTNPEDCPDD